MLPMCATYGFDPQFEPFFERIYEKYRKHMRQVIWDILRHREDTEDAMQNAWLAISRNIETLARMDEPAVRVYVCKCAKSAALNMLAEQRKSEKVLPLEDYLGVSDENIPADYITRQNYEKLLEALRGMPEIYRDVLSMEYIYGMKPREIAPALGRPIETVKSQLKRGKAYLREQLKEEMKP